MLTAFQRHTWLDMMKAVLFFKLQQLNLSKPRYQDCLREWLAATMQLHWKFVWSRGIILNYLKFHLQNWQLHVGACLCSGDVSPWLYNLTTGMSQNNTVRLGWVMSSVSTSKFAGFQLEFNWPRMSWLLEYCADCLTSKSAAILKGFFNLLSLISSTNAFRLQCQFQLMPSSTKSRIASMAIKDLPLHAELPSCVARQLLQHVWLSV